CERPRPAERTGLPSHRTCCSAAHANPRRRAPATNLAPPSQVPPARRRRESSECVQFPLAVRRVLWPSPTARRPPQCRNTNEITVGSPRQRRACPVLCVTVREKQGLAKDHRRPATSETKSRGC